MKYIYLAIIAFLISLLGFSNAAMAQTVPDTAPVMHGAAKYSMPQSAIDAGIDGKVTVAISIDKTGKTTSAVLISQPIWPCGSSPSGALKELSSTLSDAMMKLSFSPAIKDGKPISDKIGLTFELKNPKLEPKPAEIDPVTGKPKPNLVVGGILNGKASFLPQPKYPSAAREIQVSGTVSVLILIDEGGKVIRAGAINGPYSLQAVSRAVACEATFKPTLLSGNPVKVSGIITYDFVP